MSDETEITVSDKMKTQLDAGELSQAKSTLSKAWRELIPEPPARFVVSLREIDQDAVREAMRRWKKSGKRPPVSLKNEGDDWVIRLSRGERLKLGRLPRSETRLLTELGTAASRYKPTLLTARITDSGPIVTIEMISPKKSYDQESARRTNELNEALDVLTLNRGLSED